MTIAACYVSHEGVVLGADSTSTMMRDGQPYRHFDHQQKIFEIGEDSSLGITMWGLGGLASKSYRTLIAQLGDELQATPATSVRDVAERFAAMFWATYVSDFGSLISRFRDLVRMSDRTPDEEAELNSLSNLGGGFCIGGRTWSSRQPAAAVVNYGPEKDRPEIEDVARDRTKYWGVPNLLERLMFGMDNRLFGKILNSEKWSGTSEDLFAVLQDDMLNVPLNMPLREAIDWVYSSILTTIKAIKFSSDPPVCGGPVEVAVITSDRKFRWVKHKRLDEAVTRHHSSH